MKALAQYTVIAGIVAGAFVAGTGWQAMAEDVKDLKEVVPGIAAAASANTSAIGELIILEREKSAAKAAVVADRLARKREANGTPP